MHSLRHCGLRPNRHRHPIPNNIAVPTSPSHSAQNTKKHRKYAEIFCFRIALKQLPLKLCHSPGQSVVASLAANATAAKSFNKNKMDNKMRHNISMHIIFSQNRNYIKIYTFSRKNNKAQK
jgi:hypothetical protein